MNLTARSAANILPNLINAVLNAPQAHVDAVNFWADSWAKSGNWWVYSQVNVLGWDPPNPAMAYATVALMTPFKPLWQPYGEAAESWMAANLPMHNGCSGLPPCPEGDKMLNSMFRVNPLSFYFGDGFTYGAPDGPEGTPKWNPVSSRENYWGYEIGEDASADFKLKDENGNPTDEWDPALYDEATGKPTALGEQLYPNSYIPWHGETRKLDPNAGSNALWDYLLEDPEPVKFPTFDEQMMAYRKFAETLAIMWNPFEPQSYIWNPRYSTAAYFVRPFAKILCPQCNPYDPFMPVGWKPSDGFPEPVNDGWQPLFPWQAKTPTGLPLPTEDYLEPDYVPADESDAGAEDTTVLAARQAEAEESTEEAAPAESDLSKTLQAIQAKATEILKPQDKTEEPTTPVEETPVEETPVEETPVDETPVEETPVEETPVEETPVEETPVEETPVEETPVEEAPEETEAAEEATSDPVADAVKSVRDKFKRSNEAQESKTESNESKESTSTSSSSSSSSSGSGTSGDSSSSKRSSGSGSDKGSDS
ncbi:hypothetical protein CRI77_19425 [Mycolicibacterium duvalii]|uniref:Uncharacterized protein n=1 Tax=Mycolicibacterium duvalii TaxID=39688 RepID=A0A7I7JXF3_9MYCO|nr:hypothetical protein [Mycolicibacterium duvalii]MCV7369706.1 hypothetical protein [Mycolicibacterium duvalii]PEG38008.1 hypothetical protein CRI77_19425 [Mycolicibacterium duvalii]BBX16433.1 hypothetical protein MDUV_12930 [Mycolicibacterium duvalii]